MAGASVKMGVDVTQFKQGMREAQAAVKTLDAELKKNEAQFKATGDKETYMTQKSKLLKQELEQQKTAAKNAEQALKAMADSGVSKTSEAYQRMAQQLAGAQAAMYNTEAALNNLSVSEAKAAGGAKNLTDSVNSIGKKMSLGQVINGIDKITTGLERAAQKAVALGSQLMDTILDSARRADDTATLADVYGIPLERYLQMQRLVGGGMDTSVESMLAAQDKLARGVGKDSKEVMETLAELGVSTRGWYKEEKDGVLTVSTMKTETQLFWEAGRAIMNMSNAFDQEAAATALFGRSWKELRPLFNEYKTLDEYNAALEEQTVNSEQTVRDLAALNDAVSNLESSWTTLKDEVLGALAPALQKGAEAISGLLDNLTEYLKTEDGQKMLEQLGTAVSGLFEDIGKIDPQDVVSGFVGVFKTVTEGLQWIVKNKDTVFGALKWIIGAWAGLELAGGALQVLELVQGLKGLTGGTSAAAAAGEAAGSAWGSGFAGAVLKAAPWIIGLINLLSPTPTGNNDIFGEGGLTSEGFDALKGVIGESPINQLSIRELANIYGVDQTLKILRDPQAASFILKWLGNGGITYTSAQSTAEQMLAQYGYKPTGARYNLTDDQMRFLYAAYGVNMYDTDLGAWLGRNTNIGKGMAASGLAGMSGLFGAENALTIPAVVSQDTIVASINAAISSFGTVHIPAALDIGGAGFGSTGSASGSVGKGDVHVYDSYRMAGGRRGFANGLFSVPWDGFPAILHKGERVVPERAANYNSNIYFGNVNLNNGLEIEALTESIDRRNRRQRSGYGS